MFEYVKDKKVLVTGHTGFCGSWLSMWLDNLGAKVHGLSLAPYTTPNLYSMINSWSNDTSFIGDISDPGLVKSVVDKVQPEVIYHLAAQPLVRQSYYDPIETYRSNVMGTAEVLEAVRHCESVKAVVLVTTDKVIGRQRPLQCF